MVETLLKSAVDCLYTVRRLLQLGKQFGDERMEAACQRAFHYNTPSYRRVKEILSQGLDRADLEKPIETKRKESLCFVRDFKKLLRRKP